VKCPKCSYLGFETGNQCRNCGYDFSLIATAALERDLPLRSAVEPPTPPRWSEAVDAGLSAPEHEAGTSVRHEARADRPARERAEDLPLFHASGGDDTPLITIAPPPRAPLALRRTPLPPRRAPRATPRPPEAEPLLEFSDEAAIGQRPSRRAPGAVQDDGIPESGTGRRVLAFALDTAILVAIDATVLYLTLRIADVAVGEWRAIPILPMVAFLGLVKLAYYSVFTAFGGQTIGKMAAGIRVVGEAGAVVDPARAVRRTALAGASVLLLGLPLVPWLVGRGERTLHDRLSHTRVVAQRAH